MSKSTYFNNIPAIGNLYMRNILFEYDNIPIIFICNDCSNNLYICLCVDATFKYTCMISKISINVILKLIRDEISIYEVFKSYSDDIVIAVYENNSFTYDTTSLSNIPEEDLPSENELLELDVAEQDKIMIEMI